MFQTAPVPSGILNNIPEELKQSSKSVPLIYADNLMGLAVGPFVSKIVLGLEQDAGCVLPTLQISLPTNVMHAMARQILDVLSSADVQKSIDESFSAYKKTAEGL